MMGRQSRLKRNRRDAKFSVQCPGMLDVLSVGKGELTIAIGDSNKDRADAQRLIEEMLRKGYTLFVEGPGGDQLKVTKFLPGQMAYVVVGTPDVVPDDNSTREHMRHWADGEESHAGEEDEPGPQDHGDQAALPPDSNGEPDPPERAAPKRTRKPRIVPVAGSKTTAIGRTAGG
jgi:hypothetical protein